MFDTIAKPFGWLLLWLYDLVNDYGLAILLFALLVKLVLLPFMMKSKRNMMRTTRLQPKLKELEKRHGANKQKYQEEVAKLYREEKINPASGCIWSLIPFPILIALYQAIRKPLTVMMGVAPSLLKEGGAIYNMLEKLNFTTTYSVAYEEIAQCQFISSHFDSFSSLSDKLQAINFTSLGMDLGAEPKWNFFTTVDWSNAGEWGPALGLFLIPVIAAALTLVSSLISMKANNTGEQQGSMKAMTYVMPIITLWFAFIMPAALGVYWIASTLFSILQDLWLNAHYKKVLDAEDAANRTISAEKEAELARKRAETEALRAQNATVVNPNTSKKKQQQQAKAEQEQARAEWERKNRPVVHDDSVEPSRIGTRRYARGRAYDPYRFVNSQAPAGDASGSSVPAEADDNSSDNTNDSSEA